MVSVELKSEQQRSNCKLMNNDYDYTSIVHCLRGFALIIAIINKYFCFHEYFLISYHLFHNVEIKQFIHSCVDTHIQAITWKIIAHTNVNQ